MSCSEGNRKFVVSQEKEEEEGKEGEEGEEEKDKDRASLAGPDVVPVTAMPCRVSTRTQQADRRRQSQAIFAASQRWAGIREGRKHLKTRSRRLGL